MNKSILVFACATVALLFSIAPFSSLISQTNTTSAVPTTTPPPPSQAEKGTVYKYIQTFEVVHSGLCKIELPLEVMRVSQAELEDLRIYDPSNQEVPYRIERTKPITQTQILDANDLDITLKDKSTEIIFENPFEQLAGFEIKTSQFKQPIKSMTLKVSNDKKKWRTLAQSRPLKANYSLEYSEGHPPKSASDHLIFLKENSQTGVKEKYISIEIDDTNTARITVDSIELIATPQIPIPPQLLPNVQIERQENGNNTILSLHLGTAHIDIENIFFTIADPIFQRSLRLSVLEFKEGELQTEPLGDSLLPLQLYRTPKNSNTSIDLDRKIDSSELEIEFENKDNPPLNIEKIDIYYHPVYIVFSAEKTGTYKLRTGNPSAKKPVYDIASSNIESLLKEAKSVSINTSLQEASDYKVPSFDLALKGTPIDLSEWKYSRPILLEKQGWQRITLDPLTLSHANERLSDLRIVSNGKQIPYLLRKHSRGEWINLEASEESKAPHSDVSTWKIKLPYTRMPIQAFSARTTESVFDRTFSLYEKLENRGRTHSLILISGRWTANDSSNSSSHQDNLYLSLNHTTKLNGDTLWLDLSRKDNPPLPLNDFKVEVPVVSLLFWGKKDETHTLYYGHPGALRPKYDMALIESELWNMEPSPAAFGEEKTHRINPWGDDPENQKTGHWAFWIVLAVVMLALLALLSRLMSSSNQSSNSSSNK